MARIWIEAYGCSASHADSEMISGLLVNGGHTISDSAEDSDLGLVVTCSVKDATANRMMHRIRKLSDRPLVVAGCLPKAERHTVEKISPGSSLLGPNSLGQTLQVVDSALHGVKMVALQDTDSTKLGLPKVRLNQTVGIVEIASGCMSECTFCQTKLSKGSLHSYRVGDIVRQVQTELDDGCKEIWLTSTDNGCYGFDIGADLPGLIRAVTTIPRRFMVRIGMMNPMYMRRIRDGLLEAYSSPKVYKFLHVPVQSGSDRILHEMKRSHTSETFRDAAARFHSRFEDFTISTDVIVGFPGETEDDFEATMGMLGEVRPDVVNLSRYSARPGTDAACRDQLDVSTIRRRSKKASDLITRISHENNQKWIGWKGQVLFDERADDGIRGRNMAYKPIFVGGEVGIGESHTVRITGVTPHSLIGEIAS